MNNGKSSSKIYIITFVVIIIVFILMFILLGMAKSASNKKKNPVTPTSTTLKKEEPVIVTNFSAPLSLIIGNTSFVGNYDITIRYSGAKFSFKCTDYNIENNICNSGSTTLDAGTTVINLFEYTSSDENYLNRSDEYYIIINDDYIVLVQDRYDDISGITKILSRNGKEIMTIDNVITYYSYGSETYKGMYPNVDNNIFNYYMCDNNKVKVARTNLEKNNDFEILQNIDKGICN